jgi:hypothetical protein
MLKMMGFRWSVLLTVADPTLRTVKAFSPKCERDSVERKKERDSMIPFDAFTEIRPCEHDEDAERDHLLDDF